MDTVISTSPLWVIILGIAWDLAWKLIALWSAARNNQKHWFIPLGILNTIGLLPIVYLLMQRRKRTTEQALHNF